MKKLVKLPSGDLGYLGSVHIELEMKAKHFDMLSLARDGYYQESVLSVLRDLMDEDPWLLTYTDMVTLFTLIKCSSLGDKMVVTANCPNSVRLADGSTRQCGSKVKFDVRVTDSDIIYKKESDVIPDFTMKIGDTVEVFKIKLPSMTQETELLESYYERGYTSNDILGKNPETKEIALEFSKKRLLSHLHTNKYSLDDLMGAWSEMPMKDVAKLNEACLKASKYGISHKKYIVQCKECGGKFDYRLPLSAGLVM